MLLNFFLWNIFFVPFLSSSNVTFSKSDGGEKKTLNVKKNSSEDLNNHTQMAMVSEGSILHDVSKTNIPIELMDLEKETAKTREKPIQPRKGVGSPYDVAVMASNSSASDNNKIKSNDTLKQKFETALKSHTNATKDPLAVVSNDTSTQQQAKTQNDSKTETPKKPLKVSYETLVSLEQKLDSTQKNPFVKSSSKTIVDDQMPSPNKEIYTKTYIMTSKHPGMITPIVITILVVPMFAVLGYMALKRGQEAWKNRHYKRMDFLLDGMYND